MARIKRYLFFYCGLSVCCIMILLQILNNEDAFVQYLNKHNISSDAIYELERILETTIYFAQHGKTVKNYYKARETWTTSNLGTFLFKNLDNNDTLMQQMSEKDHIFNVMVWAHWKWLKKRHRTGLGGCSVKNCRFSGDVDFDSADAVIIHIQKGVLPKVPKRDPRQIWIFLTDESPRNAFTLAKNKPSLKKLDGVFNWSMTYRSDADIPVPYGRTLPLMYPKFDSITINNLQDLIPFWEKKQTKVVATILMSNCVPFRTKYVKELKKHTYVDFYGRCAKNNLTNECPGHIKNDCKVLTKYLFYLSFENAKCRQYLSEKSFQHAYDKGAIPVIMGPPLEDCKKLLPPNSFLHVDDFKTPELLASEMVAISKNVTRILSYHMWRNNFQVIGEHGYFDSQSSHLCRVCEALNYNTNLPKVYDLDELRLFLDPTLTCQIDV